MLAEAVKFGFPIITVMFFLAVLSLQKSNVRLHGEITIFSKTANACTGNLPPAIKEKLSDMISGHSTGGKNGTPSR